MRLLACGSRTFGAEELLYDTLDGLAFRHSIRTLVHGAAPGADLLAARWAAEHGLTVRPFPADWRRLGRAAGPVRNREMLTHGRPGLVVAFLDKSLAESRGTADMVGAAKEAGVPVILVFSATDAEGILVPG